MSPGKDDAYSNAEGSYLTFDDEGKIDRSIQAALAEVMGFAFAKADRNSKVVSLTPEIKRRDLNSKHRWDATKDEALWKGLAEACDRQQECRRRRREAQEHGSLQTWNRGL